MAEKGSNPSAVQRVVAFGRRSDGERPRCECPPPRPLCRRRPVQWPLMSQAFRTSISISQRSDRRTRTGPSRPCPAGPRPPGYPPSTTPPRRQRGSPEEREARSPCRCRRTRLRLPPRAAAPADSPLCPGRPRPPRFSFAVARVRYRRPAQGLAEPRRHRFTDRARWWAGRPGASTAPGSATTPYLRRRPRRLPP